MNTFFVFLLCLLAVLFQGCQALPISADQTAHTSSVAFGLSTGLGLGLGVPVATWVVICLHRHIHHLQIRRDRRQWRQDMAVAMRAQLAQEEATVARIPRFGGCHKEVTKPPSCHVKDSGLPPSPVASLETIDE
ncbi:hypothetical protein BDV40DRAFT_306142 [Aspergillus tamarii]|uniref:Uncharacterized protein n=1 Tax=Aspergillus tamarii TaxID=41984 RepID=A0A5N6UCP9_ASPTM|nr:hypothetical protein BDV40DRAFT_306142 [Aspergillus tamarii]